MDQSSIPFPGEISYGPMVLKVLQKFPPTLVLVHGWLFPEVGKTTRNSGSCLPILTDNRKQAEYCFESTVSEERTH